MRPDAKCYLKRTPLTLSLAVTFGHYRDTGTRAERSGQCGSSFFLLFGAYRSIHAASNRRNIARWKSRTAPPSLARAASDREDEDRLLGPEPEQRSERGRPQSGSRHPWPSGCATGNL